MSHLTFSRLASPKYTQLALIFVISIFIVAVVLLYFLTQEIDQIKRKDQQTEVHFLLNTEQQTLLNLVKDYALWDAMAVQGVLHPNTIFYQQNLIASDLNETHHISESLLVDEHFDILFCSHLTDSPTHAENLINSRTHCHFDIAPHKLQQLFQTLQTLSKKELSGYLLGNDQKLYNFAVSVVRFNPPKDEHSPQNIGYLFFFQPLTSQYLQNLAQGLNLNNLNLHPLPNYQPQPIQETQNHLILKNPFQQTVGQLTWKDPQLGQQLFYKILPFLILIATFLILFIQLYAQKIRREKDKITQLQQQIENLNQLDPLTGCATREHLYNDVKQFIKVQDTQSPINLAFVLIDIQGFNQINKYYSYRIGDQLLQILARRLTEACDTYDLRCHLSRYHSTQFSLIFYNWTDQEQLQIQLHKLIRTLNQAIILPQDAVELNFYIGISLYPEDGASVQTLFEKGEQAVQQAKQNQLTNQPIFFNAKLAKQLERIEKIDQEIAQAIEQEQFFLVFQPFVGVKSAAQQKILGAETLLRWHSPTLGDVYPDEFIPVAESSQQIVTLEHWVLDKALSHYAQLRERFGDDFHLSINLSPKTLADEGLLDYLTTLEARYQYPPDHIHLEITERLLIDKNQKHLLTQLQAHGYLISLDDFGTGYSALSYLTSMKLNVLKIDKSFIDKILNINDVDQHILHAIIEIAKALKMEIIAEGVEEHKQVRFLEAAEIEAIQGYFYSRPIKIEAFLQLPTRFNKE